MKFSKVFLSFFGTGFFPFAPGTIGSAATLPLIILLSYFINLYHLIAIIFVLLIFSTIITEKVQQKMQLHDPGWIVIDEVLGMLVTWAFIFPSIRPIDLVFVFISFRLFDIFKVWPATYFDKKVKHGFGTIFDDVISGIFAGSASYWLKIYFG